MTSATKRTISNLFILLSLLCLCDVGAAQDEPQTPSQKTKEAIEKFGRAPARVGESLEALKEAGRAVLKGTLGREASPKATAGPEDLTLPRKSPDRPLPPRFLPQGKRDPFRPISLRTRSSPRARENLSPLERYELGQLKVVGIVWDVKEPRAMVEDTSGLGYIVKVGTPIGSSEGKVKAIRPNEIVVEELHTDFYGARKKREVSMRLSES